MRVSDIMNREIVSVSPEETVSLAARLLSRHNVGSLPVQSGGRLMGIVTDRDIALRCVAAGSDPSSTPVGDIMSRSVITVNPQDDLRRASELMGLGQVRRLPVVEKGELVGMLSLGDMASWEGGEAEASRALSEISSNIREL